MKSEPRTSVFARCWPSSEGKCLSPKGNPSLQREIPHSKGKSLTPKGNPLLQREIPHSKGKSLTPKGNPLFQRCWRRDSGRPSPWPSAPRR